MNNFNNKETATQKLAEEKTKQKILQGKLEALIKSANERVACGADCMNEREATKLQKKYLSAKNDVENAPNNLNRAEEKYFTFVNGKLWFQKFKKQKAEEEVRVEASKLNYNFMKKHKELEDNINQYNSQSIYLNNMNTLLDKYIKNNKQLKKETDDNKKAVQTSSRQSYYYDDDIDTINDWISVFSFIYWVIFACIIIKFLILDGQFRDYYLLATLIGFAVFPYIIFPIHEKLKQSVQNLLKWFDLVEKKIVA